MDDANPTLELTLGGLITRAAALWPSRPALCFEGEQLNYAELLARARLHARLLAGLGVRKGDKVGLWLPNRPAWLHLQHACALLGAVVVPLNTRYKESELAYLLQQSDVSVLVTAQGDAQVDFVGILEAIEPGLGSGRARGAQDVFPLLRHVVVDGPGPHRPGLLALQELLQHAHAGAHDGPLQEALAAGVAPDDPFTILYTSGTTSKPKGAVITHRNTVPHGWFCGRVSGVDESDRILLSVPFCGSWGGLCIPGMAFARGAALVVTARFEALETLRIIERERITFWPAVDAMTMAVIDHPDFALHDHSSMRGGWFVMNTGGRDGLFEEILAKLGARQAFQPYGMTEINSVALYHHLDEPVAALAEPGGWPAAGLEVRLVDVQTQQPLDGPGQGELQFRGPRVTPGYYNKEAETRASFTDDSWFRSGDLAVRHPDGRLQFLSRLREALRINHFMVSPREIEECIMEMADVYQCFVVGVPDPRLGEAAGAYVIPAPGCQPTPEAITTHCRSRMASYKVPVHVRIVPDVPRTPGPHGDKAQKGKLREMLLAELQPGTQA